MERIIVDSVSKKFNIIQKNGSYLAARDKITEAIKHPFLFLNKNKNDVFWALKDVSFKINDGDIVGVLGRNGAGKSTLLKILSKVVSPTEGKIIINGKIVSLLEVGAGFHPELTGRENIYLNGAIMGMTKVDIEKKFDEIIEFSGIKKFLDTPLKYYSSGMYTRLAFSIATNVDADIVLLDEILSVGDIGFQEKSLKKINKIAENKKKTIILVSHNIETIKSVCNKAILLEDGRIVEQGETEKIILKYLEKFKKPIKKSDYEFSNAPGNDFFKVKSLSVASPNGSELFLKDNLEVSFVFWSLMENKNVNLSMVLYSNGHCVLNSISSVVNLEKGKYVFKCIIPENFLNSRNYSVKVIFSKNYKASYIHEEEYDFFMKDFREISWLGEWSGFVRPKLDWSINKI